jgi:hypothetical protein
MSIFWVHLEVSINMGLPWPSLTPPFPPKDRLDITATSYVAPPLLVCLFQGFDGGC